jgi:hypothetical protein
MVLQRLRAKWRAWRERRRAYRIERAVWKAEHKNEIRKLGGGGF